MRFLPVLVIIVKKETSSVSPVLYFDEIDVEFPGLNILEASEDEEKLENV